jgi:hypothetical protein
VVGTRHCRFFALGRTANYLLAMVPRTIRSPSNVRGARSATPAFLVALGGTLFALALPFVGCSSSSGPNPPQVGDCDPTANVKCMSALSGGSPGENNSGAPQEEGGAGGGTDDVNGPAFDGNLGLPGSG